MKNLNYQMIDKKKLETFCAWLADIQEKISVSDQELKAIIWESKKNIGEATTFRNEKNVQNINLRLKDLSDSAREIQARSLEIIAHLQRAMK